MKRLGGRGIEELSGEVARRPEESGTCTGHCAAVLMPDVYIRCTGSHYPSSLCDCSLLAPHAQPPGYPPARQATKVRCG